jgi:hypothetical protein
MITYRYTIYEYMTATAAMESNQAMKKQLLSRVP